MGVNFSDGDNAFTIVRHGKAMGWSQFRKMERIDPLVAKFNNKEPGRVV